MGRLLCGDGIGKEGPPRERPPWFAAGEACHHGKDRNLPGAKRGLTSDRASTLPDPLERLKGADCGLRAAEVRDYLLRHPDMVPMVVRVRDLAREGSADTELTLEVYHDPEIYDPIS